MPRAGYGHFRGMCFFLRQDGARATESCVRSAPKAWSIFRDAEVGPEERLPFCPSLVVESEKLHEFLTALLQLNPLLQLKISKPGSVPAGRDDGMTKIAERDHVLGSIRATWIRNDVVSVEHTIGIALPVAADLALKVVTKLYGFCQSLPV